MGVKGLPPAAKGPAFSTAVGLLIYPQFADIEIHASDHGMLSAFSGGNGRLARVSQWLRSSF
jgi:cell division protein FtsA